MEVFSVEDRQAICDTFSRLLGDEADEQKLRQVMESPTGFDSDLWQKFAQLGLTGILVDPAHEGAGGSLVEVEALMEQAGEYLYSGPFVSTCVIAPFLLSASDDTEKASTYLKGITDGSAIFCVAGCGTNGDWTTEPEVAAAEGAQGWLLTGTADFVSHATVANYCLVYANTAEDTGVFVVDLNDPGASITLHETDDRTIRLSSISFSGMKAHKLAGVGSEAIAASFNNALVALAGEQVGAAKRIFNITMEYLQTRYQFGQPIGAFQALKHMAADLLIELESASSAARHAASAIATEGKDQNLLVYLAGFTCADNFRRITSDAIQLHGGIAYTMEHAAHLYWRRAQTGQWLYCSSSSLREMYLKEWEKAL